MKLSRALAPLAVLLVAIAGFTTHPISAQAPGVYTDAQAKTGAAIYQTQCSACHGAKLEGITGPALAGDDFMSKWSGQTADDLRDVIATQMPLTAPGSLKPDEVLSVLSYILQQNKYPPGDAALTAAKAKTVRSLSRAEYNGKFSFRFDGRSG
jgi:mono/diheme cytochrome c family protein